MRKSGSTEITKTGFNVNCCFRKGRVGTFGGHIRTHRLCNTGALTISGDTYNHNFFTMGGSCPRPFDHIVFWSNHRVGCIEPFIPYALESGEEFEWNYRFAIILSNEESE